MAQFKLQFDPSKISEIAKRYDASEDEDALSAGQQIKNGQYTRNNLERIFDWKTGGRGRSRLRKNTDKEIIDILRLAIVAKTDRAAISVLSGLNGVGVPVASAILTALDPGRFTIIDFRALETLGVTKPNITINFYLLYLNECRKIAKENGVSLRTLDRALWQWSRDRRRGIKN